MKIDKSSFLVLATAIAASGCIIQTSDSDGDGGGGQTATNTDTSSSGNAGGGGTATSTGSGGGGQGGQGGQGGAPCDDEVGLPGDCAAAATSCKEGFVDVDLCNIAKKYFKPKVAENAVSCIVALAAEAVCDDVYKCRNDALGMACADETANDLCADIASSCKVTADECHKVADGLNADGRQALADSCGSQSEGLCYQGLQQCIDQLF